MHPLDLSYINEFFLSMNTPHVHSSFQIVKLVYFLHSTTFDIKQLFVNCRCNLWLKIQSASPCKTLPNINVFELCVRSVGFANKNWPTGVFASKFGTWPFRLSFNTPHCLLESFQFLIFSLRAHQRQPQFIVSFELLISVINNNGRASDKCDFHHH
jgi:hypothetical protein